jgi:fructose-bisphosphate aldolase class II
MIDGSSLPFEENVALTKAAAEIAHAAGASIEGELGHVGGADLDETIHRENVLTEPDEVSRFIEQTGVDALAVSIGTSHGVYKSLPNLNIERLAELHEASSVPLVLHGGSGTPDDQIQNAVRHGICKLNIYADCRMAMAKGLKRAAEAVQRPDPLPHDVFGPIKQEVAAVAKQKFELLYANNQV